MIKGKKVVREKEVGKEIHRGTEKYAFNSIMPGHHLCLYSLLFIRPVQTAKCRKQGFLSSACSAVLKPP